MSDKTTWRFSDGTLWGLSDFKAGTRYSALVIETDSTKGSIESDCRMDLFTYGCSQVITCSTRCATRLHTNIPRAGFLGLPQDYRGIVTGWFAEVDREDDDVLEWVNTIHAEFRYRGYSQWEAPLRSLLVLRQRPTRLVAEALVRASMNAGELAGEMGVIADGFLSGRWASDAPLPSEVGRGSPPQQLSIPMHENLSYEVRLTPCVPGASRKLIESLREAGVDHVILWIHLDGLWLTPLT